MRRAWRQRRGLATLASVFFGLAFVVLFAFLSRSWFVIELELDAPSDTPLRVFWTTPGSPFVVERSNAVFVRSDKDSYRVLVKPEKKTFHLQFKMDEHIDELNVRSLSASRIGRETLRIGAEEISQRMFVVGGDKGRLAGEAVRFEDNGSWLLVRIDAVHPGDKVAFTTTALFLLAGLAAVAAACALYLYGAAVPVYWLSYLVIALGVFLYSRWALELMSLPAFVTASAVCICLLALRLLLLARNAFRFFNTQSSPTVQWHRAVLPGLFLGSLFVAAFSQLPVFARFDVTELIKPTEFREQRARFAAFFDEKFSLRRVLIGVNSEVKFSLLKTSPVQKMMVGRDGFVFEGRGERRVEGKDIRRFNNFADYMGRLPLTDDELKQWARVLEARRAYLEKQNIAYVFAIAPTKNMISPEKLPRRFQGNQDGPSRYDQLSSYLKEHTTIPFVDLREALLRAKAKHDYPNLYYRIDFHWNYFGAFFAYREIIEVAKQRYPHLKLTPLELDDFAPDVEADWIDRSYLRALGLKSYAHHADQYVRMRPLDSSRFPRLLPDSGIQDTPIPNEERSHKGQPYVVKVTENENGELPGMVIFGDSFILKTMLYFSVHAKRVAFKRTVFEFPKRIIEKEKPQLLVQEILNMYILHDPPRS